LPILHEGELDGYTYVDRGLEADAQAGAHFRELELLPEALLGVRKLVRRGLVGHDPVCLRVVKPGVVERGEAVRVRSLTFRSSTPCVRLWTESVFDWSMAGILRPPSGRMTVAPPTGFASLVSTRWAKATKDWK
jgi:hypothetical protein